MVLSPPKGWWPSFWHMGFWITFIQTTAHTQTYCMCLLLCLCWKVNLQRCLIPVFYHRTLLGVPPCMDDLLQGWEIWLLLFLMCWYMSAPMANPPGVFIDFHLQTGHLLIFWCPGWAPLLSIRSPQALHHQGACIPHLLSSRVVPWPGLPQAFPLSLPYTNYAPLLMTILE